MIVILDNKNELGTTGTGGLELGDKRRVKRLMSMVENLASQPKSSIPIASEGWAETKAAYRLLENKALDVKEILACHAEKSIQRAAAHRVVLCLQDTTELDFTSQKGIAGLGRLNYTARYGMYSHPTLMVTPERVALGVLDVWQWARKAKDDPEPIKEVERWKDSYTSVADTAEKMPGTRFVNVGDRESDIRDVMEEAKNRNYVADFLFRAKHNRILATDDNDDDDSKLWDKVLKQEPIGQITFILEANGERKPRKVIQNLYVLRVTLPKIKEYEELTVTAILAKEENPPPGCKAIEWKLLTNREVNTLDEAAELVDWYRCRWLIEIFFRILKSGCKVESMQLSTMERIERLLAIYMIIAWRILHAVTLGEACPNLPCDVVFDTEEWQTAWAVSYRQKPPMEVPPLQEMVRLIAKFGGFLGRKCDGSPGPKAIWEGIEKVRHYAVGIEVARVIYAT